MSKMDYREQLIAQRVKRNSYKSLLEAKCIECLFEEGAKGNWRKQVEDCTSPGCPLFARRPKSTGYKGEDNDNESQSNI